MLLELALAAIVAQEPTIWYGPATVTYAVQFPGNAYDPQVNDVRVRFLPARGAPVERLAYYDDGVWRATLVAREAGAYRPVLLRNGKEVPHVEARPEIINLQSQLPKGFIRLQGTQRFRWDDGSPYIPVGQNLGWKGSGQSEIPDYLKQMGEDGMTWSRIWACSWDGKNPWWPNEDPDARSDELWPPALNQWQTIVEGAESANVAFQFVLFHHGLFSSDVNPNWPDHPWNKAKGGFLASPEAFFTDPEAIRRTKMWLRYAVARYGHSPAIMAWELFNEVEWVDALRKHKQFDLVGNWHRDMASYLREIDPYNRLITSSSELTHPEMFDAMDYYQPHTYPPNITATLLATKKPSEKPLFYGEFGAMGARDLGDQERFVLRDGLWAGLIANHAGPGCYWFWDRLNREIRQAEFGHVNRIVDWSDWVKRVQARPVPVTVQTEGAADLIITPGLGWGETTQFEFNLPDAEKPATLAKLSGFLQGSGGANRALMKEPLRFRFRSQQAGTATIRIIQVSKAGGVLVATVNGQPPIRREFKGDGTDRSVQETIEVPFSAGETTLTIDNTGPDWIVMQSLKVPKIGQSARAIALGEPDWLLLRLTAQPGIAEPLQGKLLQLGLLPGTYELLVRNLDTGAEQIRSIEVSGAGYELPIENAGRDTVWSIRKPSD
jgi:hypothetical protein